MLTFDPRAFGPALQDLLALERLPPLGPGQPEERMRSAIGRVSWDETGLGRPVRNVSMARACQAGLWLWFDFLDESHNLSQELPTATGSYWHGLMHRREPDYGNAKYWFRRVGDHPAYVTLHTEAARLANSADDLDPAARFLQQQAAWDPFAFIDLCESAASGQARCADFCRHVQKREWQILFTYSFDQALASCPS